MHNFLLRHLYASRISDSADQPSCLRAMMATVRLSAAGHELAMAVVTKKINLPLCYL
jgi:hypothetical protein